MHIFLPVSLGLALFISSCSKGKFQGQSNADVQEPLPNPQVFVETDLPGEANAVPLPIVIDSEASKLPSPLFVDCQGNAERAIVAELYELPPQTAKLPDFASLKSIKKICLEQLDIKVRRFSEGFPGVPNLFEWFALDLRFQVKVPTSGEYQFRLNSDDGAIFWINDQLVIDNDGVHAVLEKTNKVALTAGNHVIRVAYFQGPRFEIALELQWIPPGSSEFSYIPKNLMSRLPQ